MRLRIDYYASLREQRGLDSEELETGPIDLRGLYATLAERHGFGLRETQVRPAVNHAFCAWDRGLADGDRVVFLPPVAGG